mgnify:CR=1 FL=1
MTTEEAIEILEEVKELDDTMYAYNPVYMNALDMAIKALKEVQQYREIGTVEECREAVEKQKPKKPRLNYKPKFFGKATYTCPKCGNICLEKFANDRQNNNYCWDCGQKIDFGGCV